MPEQEYPVLLKTLTEAVGVTGLVVVSMGVQGRSMSNARSVPYAELYRDQTGFLKTPRNVFRKSQKTKSDGGLQKKRVTPSTAPRRRQRC